MDSFFINKSSIYFLKLSYSRSQYFIRNDLVDSTSLGGILMDADDDGDHTHMLAVQDNQ